MSHANRSISPRPEQTPVYRRLRRTTAYLKSCVLSVDDLSQVLLSLFPHEPYRERSLILHQMLELKREIPRTFLSAIGAEADRITGLCAEDRKEFEIWSSRGDLCPRSVTIRYMPAVYKRVSLPCLMGEHDAIRYTIEHYVRERFRCAIDYPGLKTLFVEPDGSLDTVWYPPEITVTSCSLIPSYDGSKEGPMTIV
jgi:hypothetical protein